MASLENSLRRNTTYMMVRITEVSTSQKLVVGVDARGGTYRMSMFWNGPITAVPAINEQWIVQRVDNNWFLFAKTESVGDAIDLSTLGPGDKKIEASGSLYLQGQTIFVNGTYWAPRQPVYNDLAVGTKDGVNLTFSTSHFYYDGTLRVYLNGLRILVDEEDYDPELVGREFEMPSAPGVSDTIICDYETNFLPHGVVEE